jgi:UDP-N-acetyl-2-amino-2-deoxyglucuronate dehydrogenase
MDKNFALIGAAGYIAPRHMDAIKKTGNTLIAAYDPSDSVGVIDSYFPEADFFIEFERFDRHLDKLRRTGNKIDFLSICSPNYLHDAHIRYGLRQGAEVICEKPLVLNPWNVDALSEIEQETGKRVNTILQLRLHPKIQQLKDVVDQNNSGHIYEVELTYITGRGHWYETSWKGDQNKSGGIATNIGIHFFDMLTWIFGKVVDNQVNIHDKEKAAGVIYFEKAKVSWFLSIDVKYVPNEFLKIGKRTFRSITIDGNELEFSEGFTDLHVESYRTIISGQGYGLTDSRPAIELAYQIRKSSLVGFTSDSHKFCLQ